VGTYGNAKHSSTQNITTAVTWASSSASVATVDNAGMVTAVAAGTATITANAEGFNGHVTSSALLTVTAPTQGSQPDSLLSLTIIPSSLSVGNLQATGQFLAIGTFSSAPFTRDLTNSPTLTWISSFPNDFPINTNTGGNVGATAGIASAYASGNTVITAEATSPSDGSVQTATATFACPYVAPNPTATPPVAGSCFFGSEATSLLSTLTVYHEGLGTGDWVVTAASATGTPNVLDCGTTPVAGPSICSASYPAEINGKLTSVKLTATDLSYLKDGILRFGGWSINCADETNPSPGVYTCTVSLTTDETVGVIFNDPAH
jgi:hypothetical protein